MKRWRKALTTIAIAGAAVLISFTLTQAKKPNNPGGGNGGGGGDPAPTATVLPLSSSPGFIEGISEAVDGQIEAVGILDGVGEGDIPVYWFVDSSGAVAEVELPLLVSGADTIPLGINADGMIVGWDYDPGADVFDPLFWTSAMTAAPLALPTPEGLQAIATGINDDGLVVGLLFDPASATSAGVIAWKVGELSGEAIVEDMLVLNTGATRRPFISRSAGYVAYTALTADGDRAFRLELAWDGEQIVEVPGSRTQLFDAYSTATGVNNLGTVIGEAYPAGEPDLDVYAMTLTGNLLDIPSLPGGRRKGIRYEWSYTSASAVNDANELLLSALALPIWDQTAVLAIPGGTATDLRDLARDWGRPARDINNAGWIAGQVLAPDGESDLPAVLILPQ